MVVAPGTHTLTVEYTIKDPATEAEATIAKTLSAKEYQANKVYDITANLTPEKIYYRDVNIICGTQKSIIGTVTKMFNPI